MRKPFPKLGFPQKPVSIQRADPLLDICRALSVVALPAGSDDISIGVVAGRARDDMLYDVVLPVELAKAVEAAVLFAHNNSGPVLFAFKEVLRFKVGRLNGCLRHDDPRHLGRKAQPNLSTLSSAVQDDDAPLLLKRAKFLVGRVLGHRLAPLADAARHTATSGLEADDRLVEPDEAGVSKQVQVDRLLVGVEPRSQVVLEVLEELLDLHLADPVQGWLTPRFSGGPRSGPSAATGC